MTKALVIGSFDLTHAGHFHLFTCAAEVADEVHVGVAHDSLVRAFKGNDRPIYPIDQRLFIISRCKHVTDVHIYGDASSMKADNDTAQKQLIKMLQPDFFVEGEDKKGSVLRGWLEAEGIQRISTPRLSTEITTSHFIKKIRASAESCYGFKDFAQARRDVSPYYYPS